MVMYKIVSSKIHSFVIIKKGEIVRTRFGYAIISLSFDDNKEYAYMNNFGILMFVTCEVSTNRFCF